MTFKFRARGLHHTRNTCLMEEKRGLKSMEPEASVWKTLTNLVVHVRKKIRKAFPNMTAILKMYTALPIMSCETKGNFSTL